jgi:hypothetical protein
MNMTIKQKILEAKKLLEQYAPEGEFLAYINKDEEKKLKELGGSGIIIKETGIPSFVPWLALAIGASTAVSYMGSIAQSKQLKAAAAWDKYHLDMRKMQDTIMANERARKILSEKRAAMGARGVAMGTGSTLLEQEVVVENLEDTLFWIEKGVEMDMRMIDVKLAGALTKEAWERNSSLLSGGGKTYTAYKTAT